MRIACRITALAAGSFLLAGGASAYYHFVHYNTRTGPYTAVYEKFDLNSLPNKTVLFFLPEQGPAQLASTDSLNSLSSQIRAAAKVWNDVESSDLRIAYGGTAPAELPQSSPGIDVIFDEMAPGIIALGGPTKRGTLSGFGSGLFVPITRSVVTFNQDLTQRPSYSDAFFMTAVHELGHAIGLQHTLTAATMSTEITRATSKARPLAADDIAGLSLLYPTGSFKANTGTIAGRVAASGSGLGLASVVAISPNGAAVSALSAPDGTYRIEGIPAGSYYVYAHPLPPALPAEVSPANIIPPTDADGRSIASSGSFETLFYPGLKDWQLAALLPVGAGQTLEGVNFNVQRIQRPAVHSVQAFGYPGSFAVKPAYVNFNGGRQLVAAAGSGLVANGAPAPGLSVSVLGGAASVLPNSPRAYTADYILIDFQQQFPAPPDGPRHLVFSLNNDIYVLPGGFSAVQRQPPTITSVSAAPDGSGHVLVTGTNLSAETKILFDGAAATLIEATAQGLLVGVPPAAPGHRATLTALNADGQTSMFLQAQTPTVYQYDGAFDTASLSVSPNSLPAGSESLVEITVNGAALTDGPLALGFGTSDVVVRRSWVVGPNRVLANVSIAAGAAASTLNLTLVSGLRAISQPFAVQVQPQNPRRFYLSPNAANANPAAGGLIPGSTIVMQVPNLTPLQAAAGLTLNVGGVTASNFSALAGQIAFTLPNLPAGPAIVRLQSGADSAAIVIQVDSSAGNIVSLTLGSFPLDAQRGIRNGDVLTALLNGFGDLGASIATSRVQVYINGIEQRVSQVTQVSGSTPFQLVLFSVGAVPVGTHTLIIVLDGRPSNPYEVSAR